jgi:hypothetical protein
VIVRHLDAKSLGYCNRGMRRWFERHGLDFNRFRVHGLDEREFLDTGDPMAERLVIHARERAVCSKIEHTEKKVIDG